MKNGVLRRIVAVLALALAGTQVAPGQLPPSSPPATSPAAPPQHLAAPLGKPGDLPPDGRPGAVPDNQSKDAASVAPQQTQKLAPTTPSRPVDRPATAGGADRFRLKADVDLVLVEATVRDQDGGIVNDLRREDFRVYENGVEQRIDYFSRDELPLAVALVLDCSGSMGPVLKQLHRVAFDTLSSLKPDDQVALFDFAARAEMLVGLTRNRQRITDAIAAIRAGGGTVIPDALFEAAHYLARAAPERRHAIILVSDNENTLKGYTDESRVIRQALESEAVIYSIRVEEGLHPHSMYVLLPTFRDVSVPRITHETGGEVIDARSLDSIRSAVATAISRLKQRYSLGYYSTNRRHDGAFREIEIRITDDSIDSQRKYTVYARRGYYASTEDATSLDTQP
ncbi:MAG: VWA domain-containing protein [Terriglobia bacterium]